MAQPAKKAPRDASGLPNSQGGVCIGTLDESFNRMRPVLNRAQRRLRSLLRAVVGRIDDRRLVCVEFHAVRPQSLSILKRKAKRARWGPHQALS